MENVCPVCKKDDKISKVTGIYSDGVSRVTGRLPNNEYYTGNDGKLHSYVSYQNVTFTQETQLARRLAPPEKPTLGTNWWEVLEKAGIFILFWPIVISFFAPLLLICTGPIVVLYFVSGKKFFKQKTEEYQQKKNNFETVEIPRWNLAIQRWDTLFYCYRDDIVYNPSNKEVISIADMYHYLYR
jgi:hypothetical protein